MLSEDDLRSLCQQRGSAAAALAVILAIHTSPPSRQVRSAVGNVTVRYPSRKMGVTIQAESHRNELAAIYTFEYDTDTLAYYDQPSPIKLTYPSRQGRTVGVLHTPDFFVIRTDTIGWEECKLEIELLQLQERMPHRYVRTADGQWACPPGEDYAATFGFTYRVRSSATINWVLQRNLQFLADYWHPSCPAVEPALITALQAMVRRQPGMLLHDLLALLPEAQHDALYTLIAHDHLVVDLTRYPLAEPTIVPVCLTLPEVDVPAPPEPIIPAGDALPSQAHALLTESSPAALAEAHRRYTIIGPLLQGGTHPSQPTPGRTLRRWLAAYREAQTAWGTGVVGLLPRSAQRGNRLDRLPAEAYRLIEHVLTTYYEIPKRPPLPAAYARLVHLGTEQGIPVPSFKTFGAMARRRPQHRQQLQREGSRAAYPREPIYWELSMTTPRHGDRPWEVVHADHTELDIQLVCSRTGRMLGRPWATFLVDAFSRRLVVVSLSFDPPSYRTCMRAVRQCVQRHGRLPYSLVVDGGPEFASIYFETLLAQYEVIKKTRPGAKPRFGSVIERLFGTTNTALLYTLAGNTQASREARQLTAKIDPTRLACWTLDRLSVAVERWASTIYAATEHPALGQTPQAAWNAGLAQGGARVHRQIPYDDMFVMATFPTTTKGTAKVQPNLGVKIHTLYYWADVFREPEVEGEQVPVRYDPDDAGVAFAFVRGRWVRCISEQHTRFAGRSEREIALATAELRRRRQASTGQATATAQALGAFLISLDAEEVLLNQRLRDLALRDLAQPVGDLVPAAPPFDQPAHPTLVDLTPYEDYA